MNCQKGDLAIVVNSSAGNEGRIVRCLEFIGKVNGFCGKNRWRIDKTFPTRLGQTCDHFRDDWLRPIRHQDGEDEILRIAGRPKSKEKA